MNSSDTHPLKCCLAFLVLAGVSAIQWLYLIGFFTRSSIRSSPRVYYNKTNSVDNTQYRAGVQISEQELLRRVNKLSFKVKPPSKLQLDDPYFSPSPLKLEGYNNSVLKQPKFVCGSSHSVHMILPSSPNDTETRNAIRETWGSVAQSLTWPGKALSMSIRLTFVLGVTGKERDLTEKFDRRTKAFSLKKGSAKDKETRRKYDAQTNDILQFDMIDSYQNLTRKILLAMEWVLSSCEDVQYIMKVDQDIFANLPLLLSFLKHHGKKNSIYGHIYDGGYVRREGRWATSKLAYPLDKYPVYAAGTAYVLSRSAAETVLNLCPYFPYVPIEDAFITGILASVGSVDRIHVAGFTHSEDPKPLPCVFVNDKNYFGNRMTEFDLRRIWRRHIDRGRDDNC
ncbi:beta-1,3-galactosyltransferase 1-like [Elysia marginata]|uniref:Hexosyltransferase n=1 Tax=Elysia marginata TaxID=1093978 RepID=A0AAV4HCP7_9GAST|nr:beta-1,3-galactosyltransferase 1-like [Elysia marginata]